MTVLDLLTSLPTSLSCNILRDWLSFKSVMTLNSALCKKSSRNLFVNSLQSEEYFVRDRVTIARSSEILNVLHVIGKKLRSVQFVDMPTIKQKEVVREYCNKLTHVYYNCAKKVKLRSVLRANPNIEHLEMSNGSSSSYYGKFVDIPRFQRIPLRKLQSLVVNGLRDVDGQLQYAVVGKNLVRLDLSNSGIHHSTLVILGKFCPLLRCCGLAGTGIEDNALIEFTQHCQLIAHLDLSCNNIITDAGILGAVLNLRGLKSLNISQMNLITDVSLQCIYTHCAATLHTILLYTNEDSFLHSSEAINMLLERCIHLRVLHTDLPCLFTKDAICNLTTLLLYGDDACKHNLVTIGKNCSRLEVLYLQGCRIFTHEALMAIYLGCTQLKQLYLDLEFIIECSHDEDPDRVELLKFLFELWKKVRPGLEIEWTGDFPRYSVLDMV